jgi:hypothetical protein
MKIPKKLRICPEKDTQCDLCLEHYHFSMGHSVLLDSEYDICCDCYRNYAIKAITEELELKSIDREEQ